MITCFILPKLHYTTLLLIHKYSTCNVSFFGAVSILLIITPTFIYIVIYKCTCLHFIVSQSKVMFEIKQGCYATGRTGKTQEFQNSSKIQGEYREIINFP